MQAACQVQQLIVDEMPHRRPTLAGIAFSCSINPRTLQRLLADSGRSFNNIVNSVRAERAREMVRNGNHQVSDIAYSLAYSDPAHFTRAFVRWTGMTPRNYQRGRTAPLREATKSYRPW